MIVSVDTVVSTTSPRWPDFSNRQNPLPKKSNYLCHYQLGKGTASVFYKVLVVSNQCDPDYDHPFHNGFADKTSDSFRLGTKLRIPRPPGTTGMMMIEPLWNEPLKKVSTIWTAGRDCFTRIGPIRVLRAGFQLQEDDCLSTGATTAER